VTVYIELPRGITSPTSVSPLSVLKGHPGRAMALCNRDYDKDGITDLMVKFKRSDVINLLPNRDKVPVHVTGTVGATTFEGVDVIRVIK